MSDLPTPINRHEQYLNAIANGTTDNLPTPPITREEVFLDYIARNGGGGGGDVTGVKGNAESTYRKGNVNITPENIGLGNVNNTSDAQKPVSTATQEALDLKANVADVNIFHGTAAAWDALPLSEKVKYTDAMIEGQNSNNPVGNLDALTTTDKSSAVGAINEVNGKVDASPTSESLTLKSDATAVNLFNNARVTKWGKLVIVDFDIRLSSVPASDLVICDYVFPASKSALRVTGQVTPENVTAKGLTVRIDAGTHKLTIRGGDTNVVYMTRLVYLTA